MCGKSRRRWWSIFTDFPTLAIVDTLGILAPPIWAEAAGIQHSAQAIRPFYIRATVTELLSETLMTRCGGMDWSLDPAAFRTMLTGEKGSPQISVDLLAETLQDQMDPCRTSSIVFDALQRSQTPGYTSISKKDAIAAVLRVDPQMVIDSVLSREWSNNDPSAHWRTGRASLVQAYSALPLEGALKPDAEAQMTREYNNMLALRPGAVAGEVKNEEIAGNDDVGAPPPARRDESERWRIAMAAMIKSQRRFNEARVLLEGTVDVLAPVAVLGTNALELTSPPMTLEGLKDVFGLFMTSLEKIQKLQIVGEPSARNTLDTRVQAENFRLNDLLQEIAELFSSGDPQANFEKARAYGDIFRQAVELARQFCDAQQEALLNKLSRAYQKPDFCIRREALGAGRDQLLPLPLSWDAHWYYGMQIH